MNTKNDKIIYNEKEYRALDILKKLEISYSTYYSRRIKGQTAQEAFLYCLQLKERLNIKEFGEKNKINLKTAYKSVHNNMTFEEIIIDQKEKKEKSLQKLEYFRKIGLPLEYNSLTDFCRKEQLNMIQIYKCIQKGMNLYEAVQYSLTFFPKKDIKYVCYGISFKSIGQKYRLDTNKLNFWIRKGFHYDEAIEKEVFARTFFDLKNDVRKFNYLWNLYQNEFLKGRDIQKKVTNSELQCYINSYNQMQHIKRDFIYYEFLESVGISRYKMLKLDDRVQNTLLDDPNIDFSLTELYYILDFEQGLMKDFTYTNDYHYWFYTGNKEEVLKKLKKSSDHS